MRSNFIILNPEYLMGRPLALSKFVASCRPLINQNQPKYTRINPNQPVSTPSDQNQPELIQNNPNQPESTHMNLNQPKSTRINPNQPESTWINPYYCVSNCANLYQPVSTSHHISSTPHSPPPKSPFYTLPPKYVNMVYIPPKKKYAPPPLWMFLTSSLNDIW